MAEAFSRSLTIPDKGRYRHPGVHASEVSGCSRRIAYCVMDTEKIETFISKELALIFGVGNAVHSMIQGMLHRAVKLIPDGVKVKFTFADEVPIGPPTSDVAWLLDIRSSADGVIDIYDPDGNPITRAVLEIKTKSPAGYEKLKKPESDHLDQAHIYMACFDIPFTWFFYWNKGNQNHTEPDDTFLIQFDPTRWEKLKDKIERILEHVNQGTMPEREESSKCNDCPYRMTCAPKVATSYRAPLSYPNSMRGK